MATVYSHLLTAKTWKWRYIHWSRAGSMGMYMKMMMVTKQNPKLKRVLEPSLPICKNKPPIMNPTNTCITAFRAM